MQGEKWWIWMHWPKHLRKNSFRGAAIDVFPWEPEKNGDTFQTPLQNLPNVILTPHIGGSTEEAQENIGEDVSNKFFHYLEMGITYRLTYHPCA